MLISVNPHPNIDEFRKLMKKTDDLLNKDASDHLEYYRNRNGKLLEDDVKNALDESAKGSPFEGTIEKISGQRFPDIVAAKLYGVEVKSTKSNHWTSTGSSIVESTRVDNVERIYMTFGKLGGNPIEFLSKPYEECLYEIAVTHMPRYLINMQLHSGETIFDKMGVSYDELRQMDNPISIVSNYYRSKLKPGESLWWTGDTAEESVSATIRLWKNLKPDEKRFYSVYGCVNYPEIFGGDYDRYALWLTSQGIVDPHIRDQFSAGGKEEMSLSSGKIVKLPGVYRRVKDNSKLFFRRMGQVDTKELIAHSTLDVESINTRLIKWADSVSKYSTENYELSMDAWKTYFWRSDRRDCPWWKKLL